MRSLSVLLLLPLSLFSILSVTLSQPSTYTVEVVNPSSNTPFFAVSTPLPSPPLPLPQSQSLVTPFQVSVESVGVSSLLGHCRGFALPGAVRYCAHPGDTLDVQVEVEVKPRPQEGELTHLDWSTLSLFTSATIELVVSPPSSVLFTPSTLLPDLSSSPSTDFTASSPRTVIPFRGLVRTTNTRLGVFNVSLVLHTHDVVHSFLNDTASFAVEITCSDQVFCNGAERFVSGQCIKGVDPCDDDDQCTTDTCDEEFGTCLHRLTNLTEECRGAPYCGGAHCLPQCPNDAQCGADGCGGNCGAGCAAGYACSAYQCIEATYPYSCHQPAPLLMDGESLLGDHHHVLDLSALAVADEVGVACSAYPNSNDLVFHFEVPSSLPNGAGVDVRLMGLNNIDVDTVLEIRQGRCSDKERRSINSTNEEQPEQGDDYVCSDNSEPPGGNSARITARLPPGSYYLIASTIPPYTDTPINGSAVFHTAFPQHLPVNRSDSVLTLHARFVDGYTQDCRLKECGFDGRVEDGCGKCPQLSHCNDTTFKCQPDHCVPNCHNRQCGDDGCGGECGRCPVGAGCVKDKFYCLTDSMTCNGLQPVCQGCQATEFCGSDCACHSLDYAQPDLIVKVSDLLAELSVASFNFSARSCSMQEGCITAPGQRKILRFSVSVLNQGQADVVLPDPTLHPLSFYFSPCHQHYHYNHFAEYSLISDGQVKLVGHKQAFCLEDTKQELVGRGVKCLPRFNCTSPGIQRGWSDYYGADLDCQWIDVTGLSAGEYLLRVEINQHRQIPESTYDNNVAVIKVKLP